MINGEFERPTHKTGYNYDSNTGGVTDKLTYGPGKTPGAGVFPDEQIHYSYDEVTGQHTATWTPYTRTEYDYDDLGRLKTTTVQMRNAVTLSTPDVTNYMYDNVGNLKTVTLSNHVVTTYNYDDLNRLVDETIDYINGSTTRHIAEYEYALELDGQRDYSDETTWNDAGTLSSTLRVDWTYDDWNRLIEEKHGTPSSTGYYDTTYVYDPSATA